MGTPSPVVYSEVKSIESGGVIVMENGDQLQGHMNHKGTYLECLTEFLSTIEVFVRPGSRIGYRSSDVMTPDEQE